MPKEKLKKWTESVKEYCEMKGVAYKVPKKGSKEYTAIKKIYAKKCGSCPK